MKKKRTEKKTYCVPFRTGKGSELLKMTSGKTLPPGWVVHAVVPLISSSGVYVRLSWLTHAANLGAPAVVFVV
jgi:hypothetical protein